MTRADGSRAWTRRASRALLLAGVVLVAALVLPSLPRAQQLVFRLGDDHGQVRRIDATWRRAGEREPFGGVTLRFSQAAPRSVRHALKVPDGDYVLAIDVEHAETSRSGRGTLPGAATASNEHYVRRVHLDGGETTIALVDDR